MAKKKGPLVADGFRSATAPFSHQKTELEAHGRDGVRGLFWEMGTGKTKPVCDSFVAMNDAGEITGLLVLAPNGVHRNWERNELPLHFPPDVFDRSRIFAWQTQRASTKWHAKAAAELLAYRDGPAVLLMSYNAIMTKLGGKFARKFLDTFRCLYALDESQFAKTPGAARTKRVLASSRYAPVKRILSGTLIDNSPFDAYAQIKFLDPHAWDGLGCSTFAAFKTQFGVFVKAHGKGGKEFDQCVEFKSLHLLNRVIATYGSRVLRDDVLDLPPKLYTTRYFELSPEQKRVYQEIRDEFETILDDGDTLTAALAISRMLRLQQVTSGYLPSDSDATLRPLGKDNPRLKLLVETLEGAPDGKRVVWAKFRNDIQLIAAACKAQGWSHRIYDGSVKDDRRLENLEAFQRGEVDVFVANPAAGGTGINLSVANVIVYYNTTFKLGERLQSESRTDRYGQTRSMLYVDLAAQGTIDEYIIRALRKKLGIAAICMGDSIRAWL